VWGSRAAAQLKARSRSLKSYLGPKEKKEPSLANTIAEQMRPFRGGGGTGEVSTLDQEIQALA